MNFSSKFAHCVKIIFFHGLFRFELLYQMSEVVDITDETEASDAICASSSRLEKALLAIRRIDED